MFDNYFGLVELAFSSMVVVGFCLWELRAIGRARRKIASESRSDRDDEASKS
jgi:hypothetical protein